MLQCGVPSVLVTHDFAEAYRLGDRIVVYEAGRVIQSAPRSELLWQPASETVARIMGIRNILRGTVIKATPDRIQLRWRGLTMEAVNSPTQAYLPSSEAPIAFFIRPEYVRLIRKDRGAPDPGQDRKSTRLNSSHITISYAVFCLKKKKHKTASYRRY